LAAVGGKIHPISRNGTGTPDLERAAFSLQPGQITELIGTPEGIVVFKCDKRIPADTSKNFDAERPFLEQEVLARKTTLEIGKFFNDLRVQAKPVNMMKQSGPTQAEREADALQVIKEDKLPLPPNTVAQPPLKAPPMPGQ
jgi:hypothetical protein